MNLKFVLKKERDGSGSVRDEDKYSLSVNKKKTSTGRAIVHVNEKGAHPNPQVIFVFQLLRTSSIVCGSLPLLGLSFLLFQPSQPIISFALDWDIVAEAVCRQKTISKDNKLTHHEDLWQSKEQRRRQQLICRR